MVRNLDQDGISTPGSIATVKITDDWEVKVANFSTHNNTLLTHYPPLGYRDRGILVVSVHFFHHKCTRLEQLGYF